MLVSLAATSPPVNDSATDTAVTGTTATTTQADELCVGGIIDNFNTMDTPTNSFTLLDGYNVSYLYRIVSSTGTYSSGVTIPSWKSYVACIATFKASE
jgi:hypothetical protein